MLRIHLFTTVGLIFVLTGIALLPSIFPLAAAVYCMLAYFFSLKEVSTYTSNFQFIIIYFSAIILGFACDWPINHFPFLAITFFLAATGSVARMIFFRTFGYTGFSWFEPLLLVLTVASYICAGIFSLAGWLNWVVPIPIILFQGVLAIGILNDKIQLLGFTKGGYKISIGAEAPDFNLPDQDHNMVQLSSFKGQRHLLLVFVRGDWCPGCHMMLRTYQKEAEKFRNKNIYAMAIGPDPVGVNKEMVQKLGLDFKVLADDKQRTAMTYGVQLDKYDNDFAEKYEEGIPLPASFLIDKKGIVQYVSRPDKIGEFLDPRTIFPIIDKLT